MGEVDEVEKPIQIRAAAIEEHEATGHVQYRSWRRHCIAGRAVGQQHRTRSGEQKAKSLLTADGDPGLHLHVQRWCGGRVSEADPRDEG